MDLNRIISQFINLGINPKDDDFTVLNKKFINSVVFIAFVVLWVNYIISFLLLLSNKIMLRNIFILLTLILIVLIIDIWLIYQGKHNFMTTFSNSTISTLIFIFSIYFLFSQQHERISLMDYVMPKISFMFFFMLSFLMFVVSKKKSVIDIVLSAFYMFSYDIIFKKVSGVGFIEFSGFDIITINLGIALLFVATVTTFLLQYSYLKKFESSLSKQNLQLKKAYELISTEKKALLANISKASKYLNYVLNSPADIKELKNWLLVSKPSLLVGGDLYYFCLKDNVLRIIIADSMGHGVSGAFISLYSLAMMEALIKYTDLKTPSEIIQKLYEHFNQKPNFSYDIDESMDLAIIFYNLKNKKILYTSSKIPIYLVRDGQVHRLSIHKFPFSRLIQQIPENNEFQLLPKDKLYIFTDGFSDLFRLLPREYKKFSTIKELIAEISHKNFDDQKKYFEEFIQNAEKYTVPIDDITIFGFEIT